jgi:NADH-quinone oxidoreductase subunit L
LILGKVYEHGLWLWLVGYFTAGMTAFYMFRLIFLTFHGKSRVPHDIEHHIHESPKSMTIPLIILAGLSIFGGWIGWPEILRGSNHFAHFLAPLTTSVQEARVTSGEAAQAHLGEVALMLLSEGLVVLGILFAWYLYLKQTDLPAKIESHFRGFYKLVYHKYYVDEIYDAMFVNRTKDLATTLGSFDNAVINGVGVDGAGWLTRYISRVSMWWDTWIVDGSVRLASRLIWLFSQVARMFQTGLVQTYMLVIVIGLVGFLTYYFWILHLHS